MPDPASQRRVTPERMTALVQRYATLQGLTTGPRPWRFAVEIVPGLTHPGPDGTTVAAWAVVDPDVAARVAKVRVRDIDATPIPGFDGDAELELRVTIAHEMGHVVVADALAGGPLTVPAEEKIVETWAQALVRAEGTSDAHVMARAAAGLPAALRARLATRARISASAGQRARDGGTMDPKMLAALALEGGGLMSAEGLPPEVAAWIKKAVELMSGASPHTEPDGDEARRAKEAAEAAAAKPPVAAAAPGEGAPANEDARRARAAREEAETLLAELRTMAASARPAAKDGLLATVRARLAGASGLPAIEKRIIAAPTYDSAKLVADVALELAPPADASRARSGVEHNDAAPPRPAPTLPTVEALRTEGFTDSWLVGYAGALRSGPDVAAAFLAQGRASARARVAQQQNGGK